MPVNPEKPPSEPDRNPWGVALGAGTELVVSVLLGFLAGQWLDKTFGTGPWLVLLGAMAGITLGLYQLIRATARLGRGPKRG